MKRNKLFGLALVATTLSALFFSCNGEEKIAVQEVEIQLTSEITPTSRVTSLDCQSTQIVEGQDVGVTINGAKNDHNNVVWTAGANGALTNGGNAVYYAGNNTATITAYHPYNSNWTDSIQSFSVNSDQSVEANYLNSDLLWTTKTATKSLNPVALTFSHKLAKINVTLKSDDIDDLSNATISVCGTNITTNFNPFTGALSTATANIQDIKAGVTTSADSTASCIIIPQTVASGTKLITIKHNGKTYYYTLNTDKEFVSGHSYSYTLNVKEAKVEVDLESDKIIDWNDEEITGDMEEKIETLLLPDGFTFNQTVGYYLSNNSNLTKIKFIANSNTTSNDILVTDEDGTIGYFVANGDWLEIHTNAGEYIANSNCNQMFTGRFDSCFKGITVIEFSKKFNTSKVTDMIEMFSECSSLTSLNLSNFDTSNVINMFDMFSGCSSLTSLNLTSFNTSNVTNMCQMFAGCQSLTSLNLTGFNTSNVTNMNSIFYDCISLTSVDLSNFDTSKVTDMCQMFCNCISISSLDLTKFNTSNVINMSNMFSNCENISIINLKGFDTSNVIDMSGMFNSCDNLTSLDISNFNTSKVTNMMLMFNLCSNLTSLDLSNFNTSNVTNMCQMFHYCLNLSSLDLSNFDTSNVTDMRSMFSNCESLPSLNLTSFNTSNVKVMANMFTYCRSLPLLKLSNFDTSNVTDMGGMFSGCSKLSAIDLSTFNTSNVTRMLWMFNGCSELTNIDLTSFDTSCVTEMGWMFQYCEKLTTVNISSFNTSKVIDLRNLFYGCRQLMNVDITNFSFEQQPLVTDMFYDTGNNNTTPTLSVKVGQIGYTYLTETTTDCAIGDYAKFVQPDGADWN